MSKAEHNTDTNPDTVLEIPRATVDDAVERTQVFAVSASSEAPAWAAVLADNGDRTEMHGGAVRDRAPDRGRFDLLSPIALQALAVHAERGARKYAERNWEKGYDLSTCLDSAFRHLTQLMAGDDSEDHAAAVMWNAMAFIHQRHLIQQGLLPASLAEGHVPLHIWNPVTGGRASGDVL